MHVPCFLMRGSERWQELDRCYCERFGEEQQQGLRYYYCYAALLARRAGTRCSEYSRESWVAVPFVSLVLQPLGEQAQLPSHTRSS
jgi:hypothetical protein